MIVMSFMARKLLDKMKSYTNRLEYNIIDVERFAHTYLLATMEGWWKKKIKKSGTIYNSHEWFLPRFGSADWSEFHAYVKQIPPQKLVFELIWDDNLEQVYHYLCGNVLLCDFGVEEFRRITVIAIHPVYDVQEAVKKAKDSCRDIITTSYILGILERKEQAEQTALDRMLKKIEDSQKRVIKVNLRRATSLETTLMKAQFMEIRRERDLDRLLAQVLKERFKHAST